MKCELPQGSFRVNHKGYEEVQRLKPQPLAEGEELIKISLMPEWAQPAFEGRKQLSRSRVKFMKLPFSVFTPENILLSAPTGAGKTNVAVLNILQQIALHRNPDGNFNHSNYKIVYVAPMKALIAEVVGNLSHRLKHYGVNVKP